MFKPYTFRIRFTAAALAVGVSFSLVWGMATLGYPANVQLAAAAQVVAAR